MYGYLHAVAPVMNPCLGTEREQREPKKEKRGQDQGRFLIHFYGMTECSPSSCGRDPRNEDKTGRISTLSLEAWASHTPRNRNIQSSFRVHHEKRWAGGSTSWNQDCREKYQ
ncbi:hypothetical protein CapIbe_010959 [Capra ibex]